MNNTSNILLLALAIVFTTTSPSQADIFMLKTGGQVKGQLVNKDDSPRENYVIDTFAGARVTLLADQVSKVVPQRAKIEEYERVKLQYADTVEGQWDLAEWCKAKHLSRQRKEHLHRILELDGEHREVRRLLGYRFVDGKWMTRDELKRGQGFVKRNGRWLMPAEIALDEKRDKEKKEIQDWYAKVRRWHGWVHGSKSELGQTNIREITDPLAVDALVEYMKKEKNQRIKGIYAKVLAELGTLKAVETLVDQTIKGSNKDFRYDCLDLIEDHNPPAAFKLYLNVLNKKTAKNRAINRAAMGLERLGNQGAISPLIEKLVTTHVVQVNPNQKGQTKVGFGQARNGGGGGVGFGTGKKKPKRVSFNNASVRQALLILTKKDFDYNQKAWRSWYAAEKRKQKGPQVNPRRD